MGSGDRQGPDWFGDAVRAWTPRSLVPPLASEAMRPIGDLFGFAPAVLLRGLVDTATADLVGTRLATQVGGHEASFVLRELHSDRAPLGLAVGQMGTASVDLDDVEVADVRFARVHLEARNVHIQPGVASSTVVAAPIRVRAVLDQDAMGALVARRAPQVEIELRDPDQVRLRLVAHPHWGHLDATPRVEGRTLRLDPASAAIRQRDLSRLGRRLPTVRVELPPALADVHVTAVRVADATLIVEGVVGEWRVAVGPTELDDLRRRIQGRRGIGPLRIP